LPQPERSRRDDRRDQNISRVGAVTRGDEWQPRVDEALIEESAEELYEQAPCGYISTLPDGAIVRVNHTFVEWTGASRQLLLSGTKFQSLLAIGSRIYYETHYAPLLRMQGFVNEIAFDIVRADGRLLPVLLGARQKRDADGTPLLNRITLFDATDRRRYERELLLARRKAEQTAKDKADLIAMLSHDIRNPLNAVMGVVQLLERSELPEQQRRFVRLLKSSSENMLTLLNHVLELSRAESSSFALTETPFSLQAVVEDVVSTFDAAGRQKGVAIRSSIADGVPASLIGDPVAVRQILTNLVGNAVKFTESGSVTVSIGVKETTTDAVTLAMAVSDTGIGIAPDMIDRIFNEFTQASYETTMRFGGTGLGLTITRRLLALYGSKIEVRSTPGEGSTFSFDLRLSLPTS
jgi:PAS domain S-box-containing protein